VKITLNLGGGGKGASTWVTNLKTIFCGEDPGSACQASSRCRRDGGAIPGLPLKRTRGNDQEVSLPRQDRGYQNGHLREKKGKEA